MNNVALPLTRQGGEILFYNFAWLYKFRQWKVRMILMSWKKYRYRCANEYNFNC